MSTLDFPTSIRPARVRWKLHTNTQIHRSPLSGVPTTYELPGARWEAVLEFRDWRRSELAALEVLLAKLRGPAGRVRVWNHAREVARGVATGEVESTNLLTWSEAFGNAAWDKSNVTVSEDVETSPFGAQTADKVVESVTTAGHALRRTGVLLNEQQTAFVCVKAGERFALTFLVLNGDKIGSFHVNLLSGETAFGATSLPVTFDTEHVGDGWFRLSASFAPLNVPVAADYFDIRLSPTWPIDSVVGASYAGDGTSGLYIWGAQLNPGDTAATYIPTTDQSRTRPGPCVDGADQTGTTLETFGWTPSTLFILRAGDMFEVNGELKMLTEDAHADAWGRATLTFEPPLRNSPPDCTPINTTRPSAVMMLADDDQVDIDYVRSTGSLSLRFIEAIE